MYGFSLPGELSDWLKLDALSFDVGSFIIPSWTCVGGLSTRIVFNGAWPLGLMLAVALALAARVFAVPIVLDACVARVRRLRHA